MKQRPWIASHSGREGTPDNIIASIEAGIALGSDCVEVGVRADRDGLLNITTGADPRWRELVYRPAGSA